MFANPPRVCTTQSPCRPRSRTRASRGEWPLGTNHQTPLSSPTTPNNNLIHFRRQPISDRSQFSVLLRACAPSGLPKILNSRGYKVWLPQGCIIVETILSRHQILTWKCFHNSFMFMLVLLLLQNHLIFGLDPSTETTLALSMNPLYLSPPLQLKQLILKILSYYGNWNEYNNSMLSSIPLCVYEILARRKIKK